MTDFVGKTGLLWLCTGCCIGVCMMTFALLYELGYRDRVDLNSQLVETDCRIVDQRIEGPMLCEFQCNCGCCFDGNGGCNRCNCETCTFTCYNGFIVVNYTLETRETLQTEFEIAGDVNSDDLQEALENNPIGSSFDCLYNRDEPENVRRERHPTGIFLAFAIIFVIFAGCCCSLGLGIQYIVIVDYWAGKHDKKERSVSGPKEDISSHRKEEVESDSSSEEMYDIPRDNPYGYQKEKKSDSTSSDTKSDEMRDTSRGYRSSSNDELEKYRAGRSNSNDSSSAVFAGVMMEIPNDDDPTSSAESFGESD